MYKDELKTDFYLLNRINLSISCLAGKIFVVKIMVFTDGNLDSIYSVVHNNVEYNFEQS